MELNPLDMQYWNRFVRRQGPSLLPWLALAGVMWFAIGAADPSETVRFALYRPSAAQFYVDSGAVVGEKVEYARVAAETVPFGERGDIGLVCPQTDRDDPRGFRVFAEGRWYMWGHRRRPQSGDRTLGQPGDVPFCADFDGDGQSDVGVFRDGTWFVQYRSGDATPISFRFGIAGDIPVALNVKGAGNGADRKNVVYGVYRRGIWYIDAHGTGSAEATYAFGGLPQDVPLLIPRWSRASAANPGYSLVIFRDGVWYIKCDPAGTEVLTFAFGTAGDLPGFVR